MKIQQGGQLETFGMEEGLKLSEVRISFEENNRMFYLTLVSTDKKENGLPQESLSYLTIDEMLDLKTEINQALFNLIN